MTPCQNEKWDITNRPHTKTKVQLLNAYIESWFTIWLAQYKKHPGWLNRKLIIVDLFAGTGKYFENGNVVPGSPLIFLQHALKQIERIKSFDLKIEFYFVEADPANHQCLANNVNEFLGKLDDETKERFVCNIFQSDCHSIYKEKILVPLNSYKKSPLFLFIDPYGIGVSNEMVQDFMLLPHKKDILFNFITMGVQRVKGAVVNQGENPTKLRSTLSKFLGREDLNLNQDTRSLLAQFAQSTFGDNDFHVIVYDMPYPKRKGELYHLLLATRNPKIITVAEKLFSKVKKVRQPSLFEPDFQKY